MDCHKNLKKTLKMDPEMAYIVFYRTGDAKVQKIELDLNISDDKFEKEVYEKLLLTTRNISVDKDIFKGLLSQDECSNHNENMVNLD